MSRLRHTLILPAILLGIVPTLVVPASAALAAGPVDVFIADVDDRPDPVYSHSTVSYFVMVGNRGPGTATAVTLTAQLPTGMSFQPSGSDDRCSATLTTVTCDLSTLPRSGTASLVIGLTPTTDGLLSMTFIVSAAEPDTDRSNNTQTETTNVTVPVDADVSLELDAGAGPRYAGEPFFISAEVFNSGPAPATGATAVLRLPTGISVLSPSVSCIPDNAGAVCTIGPMDLPSPGGSIALLQMSASAAGDYTISGSLTADQPDPQPANNTDSITFTVTPAADVAVTVVESADPTGPGQALTYTATVTNHGPSPASAVRLTDEWAGAVSGGLTLLTVGASQGQCVLIAPDRINCDLGELASGATAAVTVRLRPRGVGSVTNQAQVTATEHDRDPANNLATETTLVR